MASEAAPTFLDDALVATHLPWESLVEAVEQGMADYSRRDGTVCQPVRSTFDIHDFNGWFGSMSAYSSRSQVVATKLVTAYPRNTACAVIQSTVLLHDPTDGRLLAVMAGEQITARRTAAASVVATRHLATSCRRLAILGSGVQARAHARAFVASNLGVEEVRIWARNSAAASQLVSSLAEEHPGVKFRHCESTQQCIDGADVITTTTSSPDPILFDNWVVKQGVHINAVGGKVPKKTELEPALMHRATLYTDSREGAASEMGDTAVQFYGEIGEVVCGSLSPKSGGISAFVSFGMAVQDAVAARLVWDGYQASRA